MSPLELAAIFHKHAWEGLNASTDAFGRGIIFSGDSMVRQLFANVVAALRGRTDEVTDVSFIRDSVYVAYEDGDHYAITRGPTEADREFTIANCEMLGNWFGNADLFSPATWRKVGKKGKWRQAGHHCPRGGGAATANSKRKPLFVLMYALDRVPNFINAHLPLRSDLFTLTRPRLRIGGYLFWLMDAPRVGVSKQFGPLNATLAAFTERMHRYLEGDRMRRFVWLTTPFAQIGHDYTNLMGHMPTRNAKMRRWLLGDGLPFAGDGSPPPYDAPLLPAEADGRDQWETFIGLNKDEDADHARAVANGALNRSRAAAVMPPVLLERWREAAAARRVRLCGGGGGSEGAAKVSGYNACRRQRYLLDMAGVADVAYRDAEVRPRRDRLHFTCGWRWFHHSLEHINDLAPNPYNCADPFNQAVVQYLASMLLSMGG